jgi:hypothetical protein
LTAKIKKQPGMSCTIILFPSRKTLGIQNTQPKQHCIPRAVESFILVVPKGGHWSSTKTFEHYDNKRYTKKPHKNFKSYFILEIECMTFLCW